MTSQDQVPRLLALAPFVMNHPGVRVEDAARKFGVTPAQILKDLNILWMCGLPNNDGGDLIEVDMEAAEAGGIIVIDNADYLARPMRFTADEATGLLVALRAIETTATGTARAAAGSAMAKLRESMGGLGDESVVIALETGEERFRAALVDAIEQGRRVRLTYESRSGETSQPEVDPIRIVVRDGAAYLSAWSLPREAWRTYRLDRVQGVEVLAEDSEPHGEEPRWDAGWFDPSNGANVVTLDIEPSGRWVTEYYPTTQVEEIGGGRVRASFVVADPAWLTSLLLRLAGDVRGVVPPGAGDGAVEAAREALLAYEALDAGMR